MTERLVQFTALPLERRLETMRTLKGYIICSVTWRVSEVRKDKLRSQEILHWNGVSSAFLSVQSHLSEMLQEAKIIWPTRDSNHRKRNPGEAVQPNV